MDTGFWEYLLIDFNSPQCCSLLPTLIPKVAADAQRNSWSPWVDNRSPGLVLTLHGPLLPGSCAGRPFGLPADVAAKDEGLKACAWGLLSVTRSPWRSPRSGEISASSLAKLGPSQPLAPSSPWLPAVLLWGIWENPWVPSMLQRSWRSPGILVQHVYCFFLPLHWAPQHPHASVLGCGHVHQCSKQGAGEKPIFLGLPSRTFILQGVGATRVTSGFPFLGFLPCPHPPPSLMAETHLWCPEWSGL